MHHYLHQLLGRSQWGDKEAKETYEKINKWSEKIGLGSLLDDQAGANYVKGIYHDKILDLNIAIFDGGFGGNSFLPILLESYTFKDGVLLIEEPEISLHPGAQSEVLDFFVEMVNERNHQIIFTSHSEYMVKQIARLLRDEKITSDQCTLYVAKKETNSGTIFEKEDNGDLVDRLKKGQEILLELTKRN